MTLTTITIGLLLAFLFSITNATSYTRGEKGGYISGLEDGMKAQLEQVNDKEYRVKLNK